MPKITKVNAREILDSRGNPTIEVEVWAGRYCGKSHVPSGSSVGLNEALELRDNDERRYHGKGVLKAINSVINEISVPVVGQDVLDQTKIDRLMIELDGTKNKSRLGGNAILGVSLATAKAAALSLNKRLYEYLAQENTFVIPTPMINIINGGLHANNNLAVQEFMIVPLQDSSFREMIRKSCEVFYTLKRILNKNKYSINVGDEGGFAPNFDANEVALDYIMEAIDSMGYIDDFKISLDIASSTFYEANGERYCINNEDFNYKELTGFYLNLCRKYPIISIEDGMAEQDIKGWQYLTKNLGKKIQLVGDDVFVTNPEILKCGINNNIANAILIKPNQIGTITEMLETMSIAKAHNYNSVISHRSGETEDTTIAHIAVATCCGQIKTGSLSRSERVAKYNELLRIEENIL